MIHIFKNIDPNGTALISNQRTFSYGQLSEYIYARQSNVKADYLLCHENDLENLLNFLCIISAGKKAVFAGKHLDSIHQNQIAKQFDLEILDRPLTETTNEFADFEYDASQIFLGVLSSGTTGLPKVIWKDYQSWFSAFPAQSQIFKINANDRIFVLNALGYSANLNSVVHGLSIGATIVLGELQQISNWKTQFNDLKVTSVFMVPSHLRLIFKEKEKFVGLKSIVSAGEKLDSTTAKKIIDSCPNACLTEYYGAAELGHISFHQNEDIINFPFSIGKPFPAVELEIINKEIWVESPYVSPEYRQKATVHDLGEIDSYGNLIVLGRAGRMFNRRGLNIFAEEIENAALQHSKVSEARCIQQSNKITLYIVTHSPTSKKDIHSFLLSKLSKDKMPNFIEIVNEIPRNLSGKIDEQAMLKVFAEEDLKD